MRCAHCSTMLPDAAETCPVCGSKGRIDDRATSIAVLQPTVSQTLGDKPHSGSPRPILGATTRNTGRPWALFGVAFVLVALLLGSTAFAFTSQNDLTATRGTLTATRGTLTSTQGDLESARNDLKVANASLVTANADLQSTRQALQQEQSARAAATAQVAQLQKQVALQTGCIQSLNANVVELRSISDLMSANYNRSTSGSVWATAKNARDTALLNTIDDYYQGFSSAYQGFKSTANSWIATGNTQISIASQQLATMNAEIAKMNAANDQIGAAFGSFASHLSGTNTTCGF